MHDLAVLHPPSDDVAGYRDPAAAAGIGNVVYISTTSVYRPDTRYGSSKILAEWPITRDQRLERARKHRVAIKESQKHFEAFLTDLGPGPHKAVREHRAASRAEWKKKKQARRKRPPNK